MMSGMDMDMDSPTLAEPLPDSPVPAPVSGPRGWRPWTAPAALVAGVVLAAVGGLIVDIPAALFFGVKIDSSKLPAGLEIADTAIQDLAFVAAVVIFAQLGGAPFRRGSLACGLLRRWRAVGAVVVTILIFLIFTAIWSSAMEVSTKEKLLEQLGANESTLLLLASAALTCVMAPICEEVLFRGYFSLRFPTGTAGSWPRSSRGSSSAVCTPARRRLSISCRLPFWGSPYACSIA